MHFSFIMAGVFISMNLSCQLALFGLMASYLIFNTATYIDPLIQVAGPVIFVYICTVRPAYDTLMLTILMSVVGFSLNVFVFSILRITSRPCTARPKIVCLLSSQGVFSVVMKN